MSSASVRMYVPLPQATRSVAVGGVQSTSAIVVDRDLPRDARNLDAGAGVFVVVATLEFQRRVARRQLRERARRIAAASARDRRARTRPASRRRPRLRRRPSSSRSRSAPWRRTPCARRAALARTWWPRRSRSGGGPDASGSSVPVWPAFSAAKKPLGVLQRGVRRTALRLVEQQHPVHPPPRAPGDGRGHQGCGFLSAATAASISCDRRSPVSIESSYAKCSCGTE